MLPQDVVVKHDRVERRHDLRVGRSVDDLVLILERRLQKLKRPVRLREISLLDRRLQIRFQVFDDLLLSDSRHQQQTNTMR